jgi:NAD(P)-dependent dehydrogenase (short-subunit alcohol dehydrogenase family)
MRKLVDRVPVVTGAAEGIGRAVAHQLARKGCLLALVDLNVEGLAETAGQISSLGARASVHVADVSNKIAVSRLPEAILSQHGNVHILVNNAGVSLAGPFETIRLEDLEWIFGVNFWGAIFGVTCVYPGAVNTNLVRSGRSWDEQKKEEEAQFVVSRSIPVKRSPPASFAALRKIRLEP